MSIQELDMSADRKSAIFMHIQKTAGTSIVDLARQHYQQKNIISHGDYLEGVNHFPLKGDFWINEQVISNFRNVPFLSGHFGHDFAKLFMHGRYSFTFLRDPVERVLSFYYFCKNRNPNEFEIYRLCRQSSLDEFLKMGLEHPEVNFFIWNNQVWQLACGFGNPENRDLSSFEPTELLDLAIRHLKDFSYIGFAETFEKDRDKILIDLEIAPPKEKIILNANPGRPTSKDLPRSTLTLLEQLTQLDQILYQSAWSQRNSELIKMTKVMNNQYHIPQQVNDVRPHDQSDSSMQTVDELQRIQNIYLELMQSSLTGNIYRDASQAPFGSNTFIPQLREHGLDWPSQAQTMIGVKRLANLRALTESVIADNVPGDLIETGVWRGGACILMRAVLYAYNITDRYVWAADSFEGLPPANEPQYPADAGSDFHKYDELAVTLEQVQENFRAYGLLDEQTKFIKGWFKDTLPNAPIEQLALIRLDGDMYESTMDALTSLYPKLSPHGYVIIDDYHVVPACKAAVNDYCSANGLQPEIVEIDGVGVYWRKSPATKCDTEIIRLNQSAESLDVQIARLNQAVVELSGNVITRLNQAVSERDVQIARLNQAAVALSQSVITQLNQAMAERDGQVVILNQSIAERDMQITRLNQSIAELNEKVRALLSSTSWRITKPIRATKNIIDAVRLSYSPIATSRNNDQPRSGTAHYPSAPEVKLIDAASVHGGNPILSSQERSETKEPIYKSAFQLPVVERTSPVLIWEDDLHVKINDVSFHLSYDTGELRGGNSTADDFLLGKPRHMVEKSVEIGQQQKISKIFEMGILKGGSVVLYDQIFQPLKIAAIDHTPEPINALTKYIAKHSKLDVIKPYYGVSQADRLNMEKILSFEFPDKDIDLIIDDASHMYEETREAFNICFPYLTPGGLYIIEDWAWAHWADDPWQSKNSTFSDKTALSNLLIELFMLAASRPDFIKEIFIDHNSIIIEKGYGRLPTDNFNIADHYLLRGKHFGAWL